MFLAPQLKGYHLEFDTGAKVFKNLNDWLPDGGQSFQISLVI